MSVRVRVQNFQSIKDVEFVIDGFAVITGPNNSGKTALMRAIHGVFTNGSPGPLIRKGEAFLSVEIEFGDGTKVLWEKGWEKPEQKGKVVNRYTVNGLVINSVGKGAPPEVEALGVQQIIASTDRVWPQIAEQFDGVLFLVNRPASAIAEALSDVDRVGRLSNALKLSEKDRRTSSSELEIRRKDLKKLKTDLDRFVGLEQVSPKVRELTTLLGEVQRLGLQIQDLTRLSKAYAGSSGLVNFFADYDAVAIQVGDLGNQVQRAKELLDHLNAARLFQRKLSTATTSFSPLKNFIPIITPDSTRASKLSEAIKAVTAFSRRRLAANKELDLLSSISMPNIPDETEACLARERLRAALEARTNQSQAKAELENVEILLSKARMSLKAAESKVAELLGDRGICPTCNTIHDGTHEERL